MPLGDDFNVTKKKGSLVYLTCDQALFSFRSLEHSGGKGETKSRAWYDSSTERLPPTFLIDWHSTKQPIKISSACTILGMQIPHNGNSQKVTQMLAKIRKLQATIYLLGTSAQIYRIANLKVPLLYMVALSLS